MKPKQNNNGLLSSTEGWLGTEVLPDGNDLIKLSRTLGVIASPGCPFGR